MHLRLDLQDAFKEGETRHAEELMESLAITYQHATPQSMANQWWFWNCEGVPDPLPPYLKELDIDPLKCVGWGLSASEAKKISSREKDH